MADIVVYSKWVTQNLIKLPGIASDATVDKVEQHRAALQDCLSHLSSAGRIKLEGPDLSIRPIVVGVQAIFEHTLLCQLEKGLLKKVDVTFTTKKPPTPLSGAENVVPDCLATPAVLNSPGCIDTIISRQYLLRKLITCPEVSMHSYYAQKHDVCEQGYFDSFCEKNAPQFNARQVSEIPDALSGATYHIINHDNHEQWFGIRFSQASSSLNQCILFSDIELEGEKDFLFKWTAKNAQL